jgi:hypothetical protein
LSGKNDRLATVFKNSTKNEIIIQDEAIGVKVLKQARKNHRVGKFRFHGEIIETNLN